jgi:thiamine-phosphate pyrophosphorylase
MLARRSWQTWHMSDRRERLRAASLYLVCDARPDEFVVAALRGGVDIVQLRIKDGDDQRIVDTARRFARVCHDAGALLVLNDRPDLVLAAGADGVHVGQDDGPVPNARALLGPDRLIGLSTHTPGQIDAANAAEVDYIGVGPVYATPTKPGRPAVGPELVQYAARTARMPFFAIGGLDARNLGQAVKAGATRAAVVRAIAEAANPERAAAALRERLGGAGVREQEAGVGAA